MKALVECLIAWLDEEPSDSKAWKILKMMATATLDRADSAKQQLREIEVLDVAMSCKPEQVWSYDGAKKWFNGANPARYLEGRRADLEAYFLKRNLTQGLKLVKRNTTGHHRAPWYFATYSILPAITEEPAPEQVAMAEPDHTDTGVVKDGITYEVTKPGEIKLSWLGRLVMGKGAFVTRSGRGLLWAAWALASAIILLSCGYLFLAMRHVNRPLQTNDLVILLALVAFGWIIWRMLLRPMIWLLDDRIILAGDALMKLKEDAAQLDMAKDDVHRYVRLVRYSAVCPICAGNIELRYGYGPNYRRIFGCCSEVPAEHVFTFDRVTRTGQRCAR